MTIILGLPRFDPNYIPLIMANPDQSSKNRATRESFGFCVWLFWVYISNCLSSEKKLTLRFQLHEYIDQWPWTELPPFSRMPWLGWWYIFSKICLFFSSFLLCRIRVWPLFIHSCQKYYLGNMPPKLFSTKSR